MSLLLHAACTSTWTNPHSSRGYFKSWVFAIQTENENSPHILSVGFHHLKSWNLPSNKQAQSWNVGQSWASESKNYRMFLFKLKVTPAQEFVKTLTSCSFCTKHAHHSNHKRIKYLKKNNVKDFSLKKSRCASPLLPPDLESGSRPIHSGGPRRPHGAHLHSAVCREGRGTERPAECVRSYYQRLIPANTCLKLN